MADYRRLIEACLSLWACDNQAFYLLFHLLSQGFNPKLIQVWSREPHWHKRFCWPELIDWFKFFVLNISNKFFTPVMLQRQSVERRTIWLSATLFPEHLTNFFYSSCALIAACSLCVFVLEIYDAVLTAAETVYVSHYLYRTWLSVSTHFLSFIRCLFCWLQ